MILNSKKKTAKDYLEKFQRLILETEYVENKAHEKYYLKPDEEFRQIYVDPETNKARSELSIHWFVSNYGTVITAKPEHLKWVSPIKGKNKSRRGYLNPKIKINGKETTLNLSIGLLVALVWTNEDDHYGRGFERLKNDGFISIGLMNVDDAVNGHHFLDRHDNRVGNTQILQAKEHAALHRLAKDPFNLDKVFDLADITAKAEPNRPTVIFPGVTVNEVTGEIKTGQEIFLTTLDKLKKSERFDRFLNALCNFFSSNIITINEDGDVTTVPVDQFDKDEELSG